MTIVVLVVLALVWAVVLGPGLLRRAMDRQSKDSIGSFHRQLHVLGRTGPSLFVPAHQLTTSALADEDAAFGEWPALSRRAGAPVLPTAGRGVPPGSRRPDPYFRPDACKRRRDVFMVLLCLLFISGLLGVIPALHVLLAVTAFVTALLAVYVALLVRLRNHAVEREAKLRYFPSVAEPESSITIRRVASR